MLKFSRFCAACLAVIVGCSDSARVKKVTAPKSKEEAKADKLSQDILAGSLPKLNDEWGPGGPDDSFRLDSGTTMFNVPFGQLLENVDSDVPVTNSLETIATKAKTTRIYPVKRAGRVLSSVVIGWSGDEVAPKAEPLNPNASSLMAEQIEDAKRIYLQNHPAPPHSFRGFSFLGINKYFLYVERDGQAEMIPIERDPANKFEPGKPVPAEKVLRALKERASRIADSDAP